MIHDILVALLVIALCGNLLWAAMLARTSAQEQVIKVFQQQEQELYDALKAMEPCPCEIETETDSSSSNY